MGLEFSEQELAAMKAELFKGFTDSQFDLAIDESKRRNLVPGQHIFFSLRSSKEYDPDLKTSVFLKKVVRITTIEALRLISQRTGEYEGQGEAEYIYLDDNKNPTIISTIPLPHPTAPNLPREPWAARVPIFRRGFKQPVVVTARFDAYAVTRKNGDAIVLTDMWARRGPEQLAKCSEGAARRVAFPEELGGLYLSEEFEKEDRANDPTPEPAPVVEIPKATVVPAINHTPATPTDEARPGHEPVAPAESTKRTPVAQTLVELHQQTAAEPVPSVSNAIPALAPVEPADPMPNEAERKATGDRIRALTASPSIVSDKLRAFILQRTGKKDTKEIPQSVWVTVLAEVETAFKISPNTLRDLIDPPATEEIF